MIDKTNGEAVLEYEKVKRILENKGRDYFIELFERIFRKKFYCFSEYWVEDRRYILKIKGSDGDVVVSWE